MRDKLLVISDVHLTHRWFNRRKYRALADLIWSAGRVLINGDWWDSHRCTFDQFLRSPWRNLFPLLKSKGTIYLYGNHDPEERCDERVNLFSVYQANSIDLKIGTWDLHFEHGHRIAPDLITRRPRLLRIPGIGYADYLFLEVVMTGLFGERWIDYRGRGCVALLKARAREHAARGQWLVCGHSHVAEIDPEIRYANSGFVGLGRLQYLQIGEYSIGPVKSRY